MGIGNIEALGDGSEDAELNELQDIDDILNRETQDGVGEGEVPPADFVSFATDGVEKDNA